MIATTITGQTRRPRPRPSGDLTRCRNYQGPAGTAGSAPERGHLWRDLEPTRLRHEQEDDQRFVCDPCRRRRFLMPPETGDTIVEMPPAFAPLTLKTLAYDVEAGPHGYPVLKRIIATKSPDGQRELAVPFDAVDAIYKTVRTTRHTRTSPGTQDDIQWAEIQGLNDQAVQRLAQLASGQFPISEYLLSRPELINACLTDRNGPAQTKVNPDQRWDSLPIHPATNNF